MLLTHDIIYIDEKFEEFDNDPQVLIHILRFGPTEDKNYSSDLS